MAFSLVYGDSHYGESPFEISPRLSRWLMLTPTSDILEEGQHRNTSASYKTLLSTLLPLLVISIPLLLVFLYLRVKLRRVYAPRTFIDVLHDEEKTPKLDGDGYLDWMPEFWRRPDKELLDQQNLDGYLFVRFMKMISIISFVGACMTLPLLVLNYNGKGHGKDLARLTLSNVTDASLYYWHCLVACLLFGMALVSNCHSCG